MDDDRVFEEAKIYTSFEQISESKEKDEESYKELPTLLEPSPQDTVQGESKD
jgi:hypothetical protein